MRAFRYGQSFCVRYDYEPTARGSFSREQDGRVFPLAAGSLQDL